jgi:hypothetical protein
MRRSPLQRAAESVHLLKAWGPWHAIRYAKGLFCLRSAAKRLRACLRQIGRVLSEANPGLTPGATICCAWVGYSPSTTRMWVPLDKSEGVVKTQ